MPRLPEIAPTPNPLPDAHQAWRDTPTLTPLSPGTVQLWLLDTEAPGLAERSADLLTPEECARAERFRHLPSRLHFLAGRSALRRLLALNLNAPDPRSIHLEILPEGKIVLAGSSLHFNVAHSAGLVIIGLARHIRIGVDIEAVRTGPDITGIASTHFTPTEIAALSAAPDDPTRRALFFRLWTRKEAVLKADGRGLALSLASIEVAHTPAAATVIVPSPAGPAVPFYLTDLPPIPGFAAALAVEHRAGSHAFPLICHRFPTGCLSP